MQPNDRNSLALRQSDINRISYQLIKIPADGIITINKRHLFLSIAIVTRNSVNDAFDEINGYNWNNLPRGNGFPSYATNLGLQTLPIEELLNPNNDTVLKNLPPLEWRKKGLQYAINPQQPLNIL
jgi:hypothetical protein